MDRAGCLSHRRRTKTDNFSMANRGGSRQLQIYDRENQRPENRKESTMFLLIFLILLVLWFLGLLTFHLTTGLIHLLLIVAVIALILHLVRGASRAV